MRRMVDGFRLGAGIASPALILVWLAAGAGLIGLQWWLGSSGIESYSGTVLKVSTDPKFGTHVALDSSSVDFFFDSIDYPQLPDVRVGDHVEILTNPQPAGWSIAVQSARGTWIDTIYGDEVVPFTPRTWVLHSALVWLALALGIVVMSFGGASLVGWIGSTQPHPVVSVVAPLIAQEAEPAQDPRPAPSSDRAQAAVWIGGITVSALPILELIGVTSALSSCNGIGGLDVLLIAITIALAAGAVTTLILASTGQKGSPQHGLARRLGIVAVVLAAVSVPVNVFVVGLSGFCLVG